MKGHFALEEEAESSQLQCSFRRPQNKIMDFQKHIPASLQEIVFYRQFTK